MGGNFKYGFIHLRSGIPAVILLAAALTGCSYELDIDLPEPDARIVVDGWIENGKQARVFLTANSPYFSNVDSASLRNLVLTRAKATLSDGENSEVLILRKDERYFPPYYYAGNTIYGETGKTYTLTAEYGGKSVQAVTTVPEPVPIDSAWFENLENEDSAGYIVIRFSDPPGSRNYYRIFTQRVGLDSRPIPSLIIAINDLYFNGETVEFTLFRAPASYLSSSEDNYYRVGETIVVSLRTMDRASFDFWSSYQDEVLNSTNPFASSLSDVRSNVEGGGLGIWSGYGLSRDTVYTVNPSN